LAFWLATIAVWRSSSTVVVVSLTAAAVSAEVAASWVVEVEIWLAAVLSTFTPSVMLRICVRMPSARRLNDRASAPTSSRRSSSIFSPERSPVASRSAALAMSRRGSAIERLRMAASTRPMTKANAPLTSMVVLAWPAMACIRAAELRARSCAAT